MGPFPTRKMRKTSTLPKAWTPFASLSTRTLRSTLTARSLALCYTLTGQGSLASGRTARSLTRRAGEPRLPWNPIPLVVGRSCKRTTLHCLKRNGNVRAALTLYHDEHQSNTPVPRTTRLPHRTTTLSNRGTLRRDTRQAVGDTLPIYWRRTCRSAPNHTVPLSPSSGNRSPPPFRTRSRRKNRMSPSLLHAASEKSLRSTPLTRRKVKLLRR